MKTLMLRLSRLPRLLLVLAFLVGTLLFGGVSPTGVIGGEGASSDAQSGAAASAEPEL